MTIKKLDYDLTVCKLPPDAPLHLPEGFFCLARTDEELSLVCETSAAPDGFCTPEDINIQYLGEYDGTHIAFITTVFSEYPSMEDEEEIGGLIFRYSNGNRIMVYREGEYTPLASAYEKGWLTDEGLAKLLAYYKQLKPYLYEW